MKKFIRSLVYLGLSAIMFAGCGEPKKTEAASTTVDDTPLAIPDGSPLYLKIALQWESSTGETFEDFASCSVPANTFGATCSISVPEARLFYSNVRFVVGTKDTTSCPIIEFHPYFYKRSTSNAYLAPDATGGTTIDCTGATTPAPAKCYGGAAPSLVPTFPENSSLYFLSQVVPQMNFDIKSENSLRWYGKGWVNYLITNNLLDTNITAPAGRNQKERERTGDPSDFNNYQLVCRDIWAKPTHQIDFIISDENINGSGLDEFQDWF